MSTQSSTTKAVAKREEFIYPVAEKGTLTISVELQKQIEWLHKQVGAKEWCGVLFYRRQEGDIDNPKTLKLRAETLYLMDIGREAYTEADFDADTMCEMWETVNDDYTYKRGLIHTHHNMTTFFSGTDMQELHDNAPTHNYYLSLIVNFAGTWTARVAFTAKRKIQMEYTNVEDEAKEFVTEKELLMMIELNIVKEREDVAVPEFFRTRYDNLKQETEARAYTQASKYSTTTRAYTGNAAANLGFTDDEDDDWGGVGSVPAAVAKPNLIGTSSAQTKSNAIITPEGNLYKGGKAFKPIGKVEADINETIMGWLQGGLKICSDMDQSKKFSDMAEAIEFFKDYFDEPDHDLAQYNWFIDQMQRGMESTFKKWWPALVQRVGMESLDLLMINNPCGAAIYDLFEAYPQFMIEMGHITKNAKKEENKLNSKKRNKVNARRR